MILDSLPQFSELKISGLDVGCSGSKPIEWDRLKGSLNYNGVDPLVNEINKLKSKFPSDKFLCAFIDDEGCKGRADELTSKIFSRTSAAADINSGYDLIKANFNSGKDLIYSDNHLTLKQTLVNLEIEQLELLKIDVDGDDFAILKAFFNLPGDFVENLLAFEIESQFHGDFGEYGNNFGNILQLANANGFYLYKLDSYTYSRASLRKPYVHSFPAQTLGGQVLWGDALFMRDGIELNDPIAISKLILILEAYELEDCSFELVEERAELLGLSPSDVSEIKSNLTLSQKTRTRRIRDLKILFVNKLNRFMRA